MTGSPWWRAHADWLKPLIGKIDIGLHVTLVDEVPITPMPRTAPSGQLPGIGAMLLKSHAGLLDRAEIAGEIAAQWNAFEDALGVPPDHIDGHLHTHVFPVIRDIILDMAGKRAPKAWLRNVNEPMARILKRGAATPKALLISALGKTFAGRAALANNGFSGIYGLRGDEDVAALFPSFLQTDATKPVMLCHPGDCAGETVACAGARINEYRYLGSAAFGEVLAERGIALCRFGAMA